MLVYELEVIHQTHRLLESGMDQAAAIERWIQAADAVKEFASCTPKTLENSLELMSIVVGLMGLAVAQIDRFPEPNIASIWKKMRLLWTLR